MIANWLNTNIFPGNSSLGFTTERSVFGEVSYRLNDQWEITVGARSADVRVNVDTLEDGTDDPSRIESSFTLDDDRKTSPKLTLTWRPADDWMIYGTWSHGFRPGIVQSRLNRCRRAARRRARHQSTGRSAIPRAGRCADGRGR